MSAELAQLIRLPTIEGQPTIEFKGPLPTLDSDPTKFKFESLGDVINLALQYLFPLAGFVLFIFLALGGFQLLISGGDPKKMEGAKNRITYAVVGFVILVASYWIVKIVELIISPNQPFF